MIKKSLSLAHRPEIARKWFEVQLVVLVISADAKRRPLEADLDVSLRPPAALPQYSRQQGADLTN